MSEPVVVLDAGVIDQVAAECGAGVVFTTDPNDLRRLLAGQPRVRVERP